MPTNHPRNLGWRALLAPLVIVTVAYFSALPWLEQPNNEALSDWITALFGIFILGYSVFVANGVTRGMDEVQIAGDRFATRQGMVMGWLASVLVMVLPPVKDLLVNLVYSAGGPDDLREAIRLGIWFGIMFTMILQALAMFAVSIWWWRRVAGPQA